MNKISACINRLVKAGKITPEAGADAQKIADGIYPDLLRELGAGDAEAQAALRTAKILTEAATAKKVRAAKNAIAADAAMRDVFAHKEGPASGLNALLTRDLNEQVGGSVESRGEALTNKLLAKVNDGFENFQTRTAGLQGPLHDIRDVIREGYGRDTGSPAAKTFLKGWNAAVEYAVKRAQAAGKTFQDLDSWRFPQFWDSGRMRELGYEDWKVRIENAVAQGRLRVINPDTGLPVARADMDARLDDAFKHIVVDEGKGVSSPFSSFKRSFHFLDADTWFEFNDRYGIQSNDLFGTMIGHLSGMGREIALMERLGPNYRGTFQKVRDAVKESIAVGENKAPNVLAMDGLGTAEKSFRVITGEANGVGNELAAAGLGTVRTALSTAQLGSAVVTAVPSDAFTSIATAIYNGVPAFNVLTRTFFDLFADNASKRAAAARLGVVSQAISHAGISAFRYADTEKTPKLFQGLSQLVMQASGIERWTRVAKRAFTMEMLGHVADQGRFGWGKMDPKLRDFFERNGFNEAEWNTLRATPQIELQGAKFFDPDQIADAGLGERFNAAVLDERRLAVLEPDARVKGLVTQGLQRGTAGGELSRSLLQYKSFPLTMMTTHLRRAANQDGYMSKMAYGVPFVTGLTLMGAVAMQAREVVKGRDPRKMDNKAFWGQAFITGGALGVWGDLLNSAVSRTGNTGLVANALGPIVGAAEDAGKLAFGSLRQIVAGQDVTFGAQAVSTLRRYAPGTSLWYVRTALDRLVWDQLQTVVDPDYRQSFRRIEQKARKDLGQEFFWRPGQAAPERGPRLPQ